MKNLEAHFKEIKKQYPKTMSKDQLYRVAHISKATALYLLQSGAIPCKDTGKKTRRYTIKTDDVIEYLRQREICPEKYKASEGWYAGTAGAKKAIAPSCWITLTPEQTKQFELFFEAEMKEMADLITIEELAVFAGYVLDDSIDSNALIELQSNVESRFGEIKIVYIILTDVCNLRCSYCAVKNIADKNHVIDTYSLSKEKYTKFVKEYVSYAISHNISDPEFIFYGGEPLLNWSALIEIVELINTTANSTITPKCTVVTNGTLLTEDKIIFCKEHKINIGLSVDGPRSITDMTRKAENGMGAYPMIMSQWEKAKKVSFQFSMQSFPTKILLVLMELRSALMMKSIFSGIERSEY